MYPLAHIYFVERVLGLKGDPAVLGSIFPDAAISIGLDWNKSHSLADILWNHFQGRDDKMASFSLGVLSHGIDPRGLDYFSDEKYKDFERGYCYEKARVFVNEVIEACCVMPEDGWWKAHNFIEMSVELYLFQKHPVLLSVLRGALSNDALIREISKKLEIPLGVSNNLVEDSFSLFKDFVAEDDINAGCLASRFQKQQYFEDNNDSIDLDKCQEIIERGKISIAEDIECFFEYAQNKVEMIWEDYIC